MLDVSDWYSVDFSNVCDCYAVDGFYARGYYFNAEGFDETVVVRACIRQDEVRGVNHYERVVGSISSIMLKTVYLCDVVVTAIDAERLDEAVRATARVRENEVCGVDHY